MISRLNFVECASRMDKVRESVLRARYQRKCGLQMPIDLATGGDSPSQDEIGNAWAKPWLRVQKGD
jgi:hypothetical protein